LTVVVDLAAFIAPLSSADGIICVNHSERIHGPWKVVDRSISFTSRSSVFGRHPFERALHFAVATQVFLTIAAILDLLVEPAYGARIGYCARAYIDVRDGCFYLLRYRYRGFQDRNARFSFGIGADG
jgi:hypothetical protein